jgi:DNA-binding NarL/FixJ family response regulator
MTKPKADKYHILLVDDHPKFRHGIKKIIEGAPKEESLILEVVGELNDGVELVEYVKNSVPDLAILDLSMPRMGGIEAAQKVKAIRPHLKILILTMHRNQEYLDQALSAGAEGYLLKEEADHELLPAISALRKGETYISNLVGSS